MKNSLIFSAALVVSSAAVALSGCKDTSKAIDPTSQVIAPNAAAMQAAMTLEQIFPDQTAIEELASGFWWSEGPVWIGGPDDGYLLFTDVPKNIMFKWSDAEGLSEFLNPSGADVGEAEGFREGGANGLIKADGASILLGDHGNRAIAQLDLATKEKTFLVSQYEGKSLNSPNDLVLRSDGAIFFTDPPYGLTDLEDSPLKELDFAGVYKLSPNGDLQVLDKSLLRPNGIILSPDGKTLYVSNALPEAAQWIRYDLEESDAVTKRTVMLNVADLRAAGIDGNPDGMAMSSEGYLFATGPGGIFVFDPTGNHIGTLALDRAAANLTFGGDGSVLYITNKDRLIRIPTRVKGLGF